MNDQIPENDLFLELCNPEAEENETALPEKKELRKEPIDTNIEEDVHGKDEINGAEKSKEIPSSTNTRPTVVTTPSSKKRMGKFVAIASISFVSAIVGSLTTAAAMPYIYPSSGNLSSTLGNTNSVLPVSTNNLSSANFPVAEIAKAVGPAVVGVSNFQASRGFSGNSGFQEVGSGSGFIIDAKKGYIVTNNHVIERAQKISVSLSDGRNLDAKLVGADARTDLAVLQISDTSNLTAVTLGDSSKLIVGEPVVAIGNPGGNNFARSVTTGVVSATNRTLNLQGEASFNLIQTDAAINPGNSGGPLVNYQGQIIGITSAKYAVQGFEGMGFAIPMTNALPTIQQLINSGIAKHPALLVSVNDQYVSYAQANNKPLGAYIDDVVANGPAAKAGITKGDVITQINEDKVQNSSDLVRELYKYNVGDKISVTFVRGEQTQKVEVTLGEISSNQR